MDEPKRRLFGATRNVSGSHAEKLKPAESEDDDSEGGERNRQKNYLEFIPSEDNRDFFNGEPRAFSYYHVSGFARSRNFSRIDVFIASPEGHYCITITGKLLKGLMMGLRLHHRATVKQLDALETQGRKQEEEVITGLTVTELVPEKDLEESPDHPNYSK